MLTYRALAHVLEKDWEGMQKDMSASTTVFKKHSGVTSKIFSTSSAFLMQIAPSTAVAVEEQEISLR